MTDLLNIYGDVLVRTTGAHGADIASQRIDKLDHGALAAVLAFHPARPVCVDLGCGLGLQGLRFALLGAEAHLYDLLPEPPLLCDVRRNAALTLRYCAQDLRLTKPRDFPERVDLAFSQRFIHYLRYADAVNLVRTLAARMSAGARFFISASGIDSELADGYVAADLPVSQRFGTLAPLMQAKHEIREPVCLYGEADLDTLMTRAGFGRLSIARSDFGNIKGVFEKLS